MRKVLQSVTVISLSLINDTQLVLADTSSPSLSSSQGRIGFGMAVEYTTIENELYMDYSPFGSNFQSKQGQNGKHVQVSPSFEIGASLFQDYYLGLVISWRSLGTSPRARAPIKGLSHFFHKFSLNNYADFLVKPGYKLYPKTMVYGLIGPNIARWQHKTKQFSQDGLTDTFNMKATSTGLGLGFGVEHQLTDTSIVSVDYVHHIHRSKKKGKYMNFWDNIMGPVKRSGNVYKEVTPSYATIAFRLTAYVGL